MSSTLLPDVPPVDLLSEDLKELLLVARDASQKAHAPISSIHVGAAMRSSGGEIYIGFNIEVASLSGSIHAEEAAIVHAVNREGASLEIVDVAVFGWKPTSGKPHSVLVSTPPCGGCRQLLFQFGSSARVVFPYGSKVEQTTLDRLLPLPFLADLRQMDP